MTGGLRRLASSRALRIAGSLGRRVLGSAALLAVALGALPEGRSQASSLDAIDRASRAFDDTLGLDFEDAHHELEGANPDDPHVALERARLALYESDCDGAAALLAAPEVSKVGDGDALAEIARGCARVIAATVIVKDAEHEVEVRYQDEADRALQGVLVDTVVKARDAIGRDLGVSWPKPTRIIVVRDHLSLSAMTGLSYEAARTTGTVAVAKWGRVTLLSPRASRHGYAWLDTVAHELTHLAVTRASRDRAPLWLQEGVAKNEEVHWRPPGPMDDRPSPDVVVLHGVDRKLDLPLDRLGQSIAMLPSADAAMVAFAEVTSFLRYFVATTGPDGLRKLLTALREHLTGDQALALVAGADLHTLDLRWRAALAERPKESLPALLELGSEPPDVRDLRERVRLAELLLGRGHVEESLTQLDRVKTAGASTDPSLRYLRGRALEAANRMKDAAAAVGEPKDVVASFGPWWAVRGRVLGGGGPGPDPDPAKGESLRQALFEAVAADPLDEESACGGALPGFLPGASGPGSSPPNPKPDLGSGGAAAPAPPSSPSARSSLYDPLYRPLCDAARLRSEPLVGQD